MPETFTPEEQKLLAPFVTNLDQPVFVLRNLPEVVMGALFSRYSRSTKSLRRILLDEFMLDKESGFAGIVGSAVENGTDQLIAVQKAEEFYDRVLVGYGDDSVAELGGAHIAVENTSNIATKVLQDARLGISPLEKSTRYVYFHEKVDGEYRFLREPVLMKSKHAQTYLDACNLLFDTYSKMIDPLSKFLMNKFPRDANVSDRAYAASIRAKTCDILRGLLPASALTNTGMYGNGRAFEYLILKMYASDLQEMRDTAALMQHELSKAIPSFVKRANDIHGKSTQEFMRKTRQNMKQFANQITPGLQPDAPEVTLVDYDPQLEEKIAAASLYTQSDLPMMQIRRHVQTLSPAQRQQIIESAWKERQNRRQRPGRAFENAYYTFDFCVNFGAFRDLQRHRVLTQEKQLLSTKHGYDTPAELAEAGMESEYRAALEAAARAYETIAADFPNEAQYVVPLAYKLRWYMTLNAREALHLIELRSMPQGHPDYRRVVQKMHAEIAKVHPAIAATMKFVHLEGVGLERLEAEKKTDQKLDAINKKYSNAPR